MNYKNKMAKSVTPPCVMSENHIVNFCTVVKTDKNCKKMTDLEEILRSTQNDNKHPSPGWDFKTPLKGRFGGANKAYSEGPKNMSFQSNKMLALHP
jgi:hypothetical protein